MASILDRYGIKEVADVVFYEINTDGTPGAPVLVLDTLKVSTIEQTAESTDARGGKGNARLISWDYGKEINVTLEDALFSPKSMALMFGGGKISNAATTITKTIQFVATDAAAAGAPTTWTDPRGNEQLIVTPEYFDEAGAEVEAAEIEKGKTYFAKFEFAAVAPRTISVTADTYPGTYYVCGDTFSRSEATGKDEMFQFIIPKAKVTSENSITLEAEGDPSVFSLSLSVLRPADGQMMKLVSYDVAEPTP